VLLGGAAAATRTETGSEPDRLDTSPTAPGGGPVVPWSPAPGVGVVVTGGDLAGGGGVVGGGVVVVVGVVTGGVLAPCEPGGAGQAGAPVQNAGWSAVSTTVVFGE
jgi:hypothetical protein